MTEAEWRLSERLAGEQGEVGSLRERLMDTLTDRRKLASEVKVLELEIARLTGVCDRDRVRVQAEAVLHHDNPRPGPRAPGKDGSVSF